MINEISSIKILQIVCDHTVKCLSTIYLKNIPSRLLEALKYNYIFKTKYTVNNISDRFKWQLCKLQI